MDDEDEPTASALQAAGVCHSSRWRQPAELRKDINRRRRQQQPFQEQHPQPQPAPFKTAPTMNQTEETDSSVHEPPALRLVDGGRVNDDEQTVTATAGSCRPPIHNTHQEEVEAADTAARRDQHTRHHYHHHQHHHHHHNNNHHHSHHHPKNQRPNIHPRLSYKGSCSSSSNRNFTSPSELQQQVAFLGRHWWPASRSTGQCKPAPVRPAALGGLLLLGVYSLIVILFAGGPNKTPPAALAYQLTNNLIANNSPPKFITSSPPLNGVSGGGGGGGGSSSEIVVRVKEGTSSIGKLIYTLRAEDPDDDPLTFGVLGSMANDLLRIENVPGNQANVYLRKELDRETTDSYQVVITLSDGKLGRGNWITKSMLIIVEDVNDNSPVFGPHRTAISIREDVKVPFVIETIEATDQDEGRFGQVMYKLDTTDTNGAPTIAGKFAIETIDGKGVISLISPLDYEQRPLYSLRVLAIDRAIENERLTATTNILISVEDCDDQPPMFTFVPSITRIPENLPVGSPVVRVAAVDGDRGIGQPINYQLVSVNGQEAGFERSLFSMDAASGQISVAHELDREWGLDSWSGGGSPNLGGGQQQQPSQPGSYVLQVRASEPPSAGRSPQDTSVTTELTVILTDVNDETPTFSQQAYYGEILENSAPESLVTFVVSATVQESTASVLLQQQQQQQQQQPPAAKVVDRDQGTNGTFTLHLEGEHSQLFDIWPREATNEASFMIKVIAGNGEASKSSVGSSLDYEKIRAFHFTIVAREKYNTNQQGAALRSQSAQMTVLLKDSNDNYPQFESELYKVEIPENAIRGMHICAVKATDPDSGLYGSQGIRYTELRGEKANKFRLDPLSGVITLKSSEHGFDRETIAQHHLIVEARDANGTGNRNTTQLLILLTDVNDQRPKFLLDQYEAFIYENELDFQSPLQVQAVDADAQNSSNSRITYSIVGGDPQQNFTIDPSTGRIRVKSSLVLTAAAQPVGNGRGVTTFNTASPPHTTMRGDDGDSDIVLESSVSPAPSSLVAQVSGLDFERIAQRRDETRQFNLTVRATDSGLPEPLTGTTQVIILVYDKNDHAPVFTRNVYTKSIREDAKEGSQVVQVLAQDGDHSPANSKITYRISSGASDKFAIDSDTGLISVANGANLDIDRAAGGQRRTNYLLNVLAFDGSFGANQKSSSALVNITIIDVNNKPPEFISLGASTANSNRSPSSSSSSSQSSLQLSHAAQHQQLMVVYVNEDAPYGLIVTRVIAMDLDSSAELRYSINWARSEARNEDMVVVEPSLIRDLFTIEPSDGTIKVSKQLDRELFDQVKLRLQVEDIAAQTADQVAQANLLVKITDVNDNRPSFKKPAYKAVVNENSIGGTSVITLSADDRDLNKTLKYSLDGAPEMLRLVRINPRSGEVTVNDKIDRELHPLINVTVKAEDYGSPHPLTGSTQLLVTVRDENDNNPMFLNGSSSNSGGSSGHHHGVSGLPWRHHDSPAAAPASDGLHEFASSASYGHSESEAATTANRSPVGPKNHSNNNSTNIVSYRHRSLGGPHGGGRDFDGAVPSAADQPSEQQEPGLPHLPLLGPGSTAWVREDAPIGHQVAYVRAEDADVGNNGRVTYLIDSSSSGGKFRIDRDSGVISVAGPLDREQNKQFSLIIEACDNYDLGYSTGESRRAFTQVNIQVTDTNDNAPIITTNLQTPIGGGGGGSGTLMGGEPISLGAAWPGPAYPGYEDIMNSPGPYELPLPECLLISEFQPLNEPILTITATDADDPSTPNGQIDLAIVNNLPQNELFTLVSIPTAQNRGTTTGPTTTITTTNRLVATTASTSPPPTTLSSTAAGNIQDYTGFGEMSLSGAAAEPASSGLSPTTTGGLVAIDETGLPTLGATASGRTTAALIEDDNDYSDINNYNRPKRSVLVESGLVPEPVAGNFYSAAASRADNTFANTHLDLRSHLRQQQQQTMTAASLTPPTSAPTTGLIMPATMSSVRHAASHSSLSSASSSAQSPGDAGELQVHIVVAQSLKERVGNYTILVRATDRGQPALSSIRPINICIQDVNNHAPVFTRPSLNHTIRILENATIGSYVTQVEAMDSDHGLNGELQYSLKATNIQNNNNDWQSFKIDRVSGVITTSKPFNRQLKRYYTLRVQAQDFGRPTSLSSDIDINIMIVNSGQYQPEFEVQTQTLQFTENVAPGVEWFTLLSTNNLDDDPALINNNQAGVNGGGTSASWQHQLAKPCYFIIDGDDQDQVFQLDRYTHRLSNQRPIDRERKANYTLLVQATNNCNKPASSAPIYARSAALVAPPSLPQQLLGDPSGRPLESAAGSNDGGLVDYRSPDGASNNGGPHSGSRVRRAFSWQGNERQQPPPRRSQQPLINGGGSSSTRGGPINDTRSILSAPPSSATGESAKLVAAAATGSDEGEAGASFNQAALEALLAADKSLLKVFIKIKDVNDNAPRFTQHVYTGGITTEANFGTVFMLVQAVDADADANSQIVYSLVKPIKRNLMGVTSSSSSSSASSASPGDGSVSGAVTAATNSRLVMDNRAAVAVENSNSMTAATMPGQAQPSRRQRRAVSPQSSSSSAKQLVTPITTQAATTTNNTTRQPHLEDHQRQLSTQMGSSASMIMNDIPMQEGDDYFVINNQTGEISLNFDPQKHMKGYFEFEVLANDTDGLFDSAKVFIYLLRQDQRVKFVLRLTPSELRQRLNKFRSVFGNITGAIVNIDSYRYYENQDGSVDKKKTSLYLHFVNPDDNTIIDVDKVLTLIDNNIEYLDELYKEFHVLSSEAAHLPLSSSALIDPIDQIRTGLMGVTSFLALILVLVIALCLNQRTRYERQLKAATVSAFGSSPLHLDPDYHSQTNLPNTNLHSQDPNPIWIQGYNDHHHHHHQDHWLAGGKSGAGGALNRGSGAHRGDDGVGGAVGVGIEDADYLSSVNSDLNSLSGVNSVSQLHYNAATTATPRDSLDSSQGGRASGSGSSSTTNERQALCRRSGGSGGRQTPQQQQQQPTSKQQLASNQQQQHHHRRPKELEVVSVAVGKQSSKQQQLVPEVGGMKGRRPLLAGADVIGGDTITHSTFGAFKEVTIYTDHEQRAQFPVHHHQQQQMQQQPKHNSAAAANNLVRTVNNSNSNITNSNASSQPTSQVNKITSQFNARHHQHQAQVRPINHQGGAANQVYISQQQSAGASGGGNVVVARHQPPPPPPPQQRIIVHTNGVDVNQGIIKVGSCQPNIIINNSNSSSSSNNKPRKSLAPSGNAQAHAGKHSNGKFVSQHLIGSGESTAADVGSKLAEAAGTVQQDNPDGIKPNLETTEL